MTSQERIPPEHQPAARLEPSSLRICLLSWINCSSSAGYFRFKFLFCWRPKSAIRDPRSPQSQEVARRSFSTSRALCSSQKGPRSLQEAGDFSVMDTKVPLSTSPPQGNPRQPPSVLLADRLRWRLVGFLSQQRCLRCSSYLPPSRVSPASRHPRRPWIRRRRWSKPFVLGLL